MSLHIKTYLLLFTYYIINTDMGEFIKTYLLLLTYYIINSDMGEFIKMTFYTIRSETFTAVRN